MTGELADRLFLALRTCATHPAGPLRAVSDLRRAYDDRSIDAAHVADVHENVRDRIAAMDMPDDRREIASLFLDAVFKGWPLK